MRMFLLRAKLGMLARMIESAQREIESLEADRVRQVDAVRERAEAELAEIDARAAFARDSLEYRVRFYARKSESLRAVMLDDQVLARRSNRARGLPAGARHV